jgi:hypothetical protein
VSDTEAPELLGLVNRTSLIWESNNGNTCLQFFMHNQGPNAGTLFHKQTELFVCEPHRLEESAFQKAGAPTGG